MSQSFANSAGSVLNSLHGSKALDPRTTNAYHIHLGTLATGARNLDVDVRFERLPAAEGLHRLIDLHTDYVRLCGEIASAVSTSSRPDLSRDWDGIRDHANMLSSQLTELGTRLGRAGESPVYRPYFSNVPRA